MVTSSIFPNWAGRGRNRTSATSAPHPVKTPTYPASAAGLPVPLLPPPSAVALDDISRFDWLLAKRSGVMVSCDSTERATLSRGLCELLREFGGLPKEETDSSVSDGRMAVTMVALCPRNVQSSAVSVVDAGGDRRW